MAPQISIQLNINLKKTAVNETIPMKLDKAWEILPKMGKNWRSKISLWFTKRHWQQWLLPKIILLCICFSGKYCWLIEILYAWHKIPKASDENQQTDILSKHSGYDQRSCLHGTLWNGLHVRGPASFCY